MKPFKLFFILTITSILLYLQCNKKEQKSERPNIVLIMADDMGYSDLGCYGGEISTPNLDQLAEDGLQFTQFYNAARCCPTRASLMTGLYPHQAGVGQMVYNNWGEGYLGHLNEQCVTIGEVLQQAGYTTLMTGKWHVGHQNKDVWPSNRGLDHFYGIHKHVDSYFKVLPGCPIYLDGKKVIPPTDDPQNALHPKEDFYTTDVFTDYALKFLEEETNDEKPFFLYLAYNAPHFPLEAMNEDIKKYMGDYMIGWDSLKRKKIKTMKKLGIVSKDLQLPENNNPRWDTLSFSDKINLDFRRAMYAAQIDRMDQNIGRLNEYLKEQGKLENTLIFFLSDNGCSAEVGMFGMNWKDYRIENYEEWKEKSGWSVSQGQTWANASNTPFRLYKKWAHEGGIATPLIAHWPEGIKERGMTDQPGHVIDIMATCCDVAGAEYPQTYNGNQIKPLEGKSLLPIFRGKVRQGHDVLYWSHMGNSAIRQGKWKLVRKNKNVNGRVVALNKNHWKLYNMQEDRAESNNLAGKYPEKVETLKAKYQQWAERCNVRSWPIEE